MDATAARAPRPRSTALPHPLTAELERLARATAAAASLEVRGVEVLAHRIPLTLRVLVQRADGTDVSLDECAAFSGPLGEAIEAAALLESAYVLEISSPGIDEELRSDRDFTSFRGFPVEVLRDDGADGPQTRLAGLLLGRDDQVVLLNQRGRTVRIPRQSVRQVRLTAPGGDP
jgi:ribosome maturation factor RimP